MLKRAQEVSKVLPKYFAILTNKISESKLLRLAP